MENMDVSTDSEVQFRNGAAVQSFTEEHDETSGDEDDTMTPGVEGSDADDEDSCSSHARFSEDYVEEVESDANANKGEEAIFKQRHKSIGPLGPAMHHIEQHTWTFVEFC